MKRLYQSTAIIDETSGGHVLGENGIASARFYLDVITLTGTTQQLDVSIEHDVDGQTYVLGSFTQATGTTNETITITNCPVNFYVRLNFTNTITVSDMRLSAERF